MHYPFVFGLFPHPEPKEKETDANILDQKTRRRAKRNSGFGLSLLFLWSYISVNIDFGEEIPVPRVCLSMPSVRFKEGVTIYAVEGEGATSSLTRSCFSEGDTIKVWWVACDRWIPCLVVSCLGGSRVYVMYDKGDNPLDSPHEPIYVLHDLTHMQWEWAQMPGEWEYDMACRHKAMRMTMRRRHSVYSCDASGNIHKEPQ